MDEKLEAAKEGAFREISALDEAHARGALDDAGWHRALAALIVPAYLRAGSVQGGSGHTGSEADWEWSRGVVAEAIDRGGTFLDVGCANGLLMESVVRWAAATGFALVPFGLDIAKELVDLAQRRMPQHRARVFCGNALGFQPEARFDLVRAGLEYVPKPRRRALVAWLLEQVTAPGGRLIIGKYNEELEERAVERALRHWGFAISGRAERAHRSEPRLAYRVVWIDAPRASDAELRFRSLRSEDLPLLQGWLSQPHIAAWFREASDLVATQAKYAPRISGDEPTHVYMIEHRGRAIGWIQWYRWADYLQHAVLLGADPTSAGLDLALGDPSLLGHGLGPRVLRAFSEQVIFADASITACICDPEERNLRSIRAFEKAGFRSVRACTASAEPRRVVALAREAHASTWRQA